MASDHEITAVRRFLHSGALYGARIDKVSQVGSTMYYSGRVDSPVGSLDLQVTAFGSRGGVARTLGEAFNLCDECHVRSHMFTWTRFSSIGMPRTALTTAELAKVAAWYEKKERAAHANPLASLFVSAATWARCRAALVGALGGA